MSWAFQPLLPATEASASSSPGTFDTGIFDQNIFDNVLGPVLTASLAVTESSDVAAFAASASSGVTASLAVTESSDAVAISGTNKTTATLAVTESSDVVAFAGTNKTTATLAVTETSDAVAVSGTNKTTATLAVTETSDTVAVSGTNKTTAALAVTETADSVAFNASASGGTVTADLAATETSDTASFAATGTQDQATGGGYWKGPVEHKYRVHPEYEDKPAKPKRKKSTPEQIVLAPDLTVQTGIVPVRPAWDVMAEMQQRAAEAEQARQDRFRAIAQADDEWLMVA